MPKSSRMTPQKRAAKKVAKNQPSKKKKVAAKRAAKRAAKAERRKEKARSQLCSDSDETDETSSSEEERRSAKRTKKKSAKKIYSVIIQVYHLKLDRPEIEVIEEILKIIVQGVEIEREVSEACADYANSNFVGFGYNLAKLLKKTAGFGKADVPPNLFPKRREASKGLVNR